MKYAILLLLLCTSCAFEWDVPKVPQKDLQTGKMESKYVYWPARHPMPPIKIDPIVGSH